MGAIESVARSRPTTKERRLSNHRPKNRAQRPISEHFGEKFAAARVARSRLERRRSLLRLAPSGPIFNHTRQGFGLADWHGAG